MEKDKDMVSGDGSLIPASIVENYEALGNEKATGLERKAQKANSQAKFQQKREARSAVANTASEAARGVMDGMANGDVVGLCKHFMQAAVSAAARSLSSIGMKRGMRKELAGEEAENIVDILKSMGQKPEQAAHGMSPSPSMGRKGPGM